MREMEEGSTRVGFSGAVIKNRNSTGCLIIKKKADGSGAGGTGSSPPPGPVADKVYMSRKKRAQLAACELESSDEDDELLELYRRKGVRGRANQLSGTSNSHVYKTGISTETEFIRKKDVIFAGNDALSGDRNRNTFDVYDFDEYDDLDDVGRVGKGHFDWLEAQGSGRMFTGVKPVMKSGGRSGFEAVPSGRHGALGDMKSFLSESSSSKKFNRRLDVKSKVAIPALKEKFDSSTSKEAIRLQGKNGVLKLMVKNKKVGGPSTAPNYNEVGRNIMSVSRDLNPKNMVTSPSLYPQGNPQSYPRNFDRMKQKSRKPESSRSSEESIDESEESDEPPQRPPKDVESRRPAKRERREDADNLSPQTFPDSRLKESKVKRGSGTEKQLLREKIRNMLVSAGWTIDYRRRRNRDYFDAVYINPSGTAYWSIIKAYDALQKQLEEDGAGGDCSPFNSISDEVLSKLTRQTQKKLEKELKRKKRDDIVSKRKKKAGPGKFVNDEHEIESTDSGTEKENLNSFIKQDGRSLKGRSQESHDAHQNSHGGNMQEQAEKRSSASNSQFVHGRKSKKIGRCTLLVRNAEKGLNSEGDGFIPYKGKRTILSWLIDSEVVKLSEKVLYMNRKRSRFLLEGWITRDGIHCGCCSKILTVSKFEIHAASKQRQPFQNIYLCSGNSLLQCQVDAWNCQHEFQCRGFNTIGVESDDPNDDACGICGDGGNLICCDGCPSTFHQSCVGVEMLPPGDWHCPHCSCKFCCLADGTSGVLQKCSLCERKFHGSCIQEMDSISASSSNPASICGRKCQEIFEQLQKLLGVKHELESGLSWSLIHRTDLDIDPSHRGFPQRVEWNSKLAVALTVMDECFLPIIDRRSGVNLIHSVLYNCGSNFNRLNYGGFYTAILERGDEIISVASIRIHGSHLAEMPFIGTRHIYRRQGMWRRLLFAIESALRSLKVEKLIVPAISELMDTWTTIFGFSALDESHKHEMKSLNMLVFPGTDMLQKMLVHKETSKRDMSMSTDLGNKSDSEISPSEIVMLDTEQTDGKSAEGIGLRDSVVSVDRNSLPSALSDTFDEAEPQILNKGTQETRSSSLESKEELVKSVPDARIVSSMEPSNDVLKARESSIRSPMENDIHGSATCDNTDINGVKAPPANLGLQPVSVSLAGDPIEKNLSDHIDKDEQFPSDDKRTCSTSEAGERLQAASELKEAFSSDASSEMDAAPETKSKAADTDSILNASGASSFVVGTCSDDNNESRPDTEKPVLNSSAEDNIKPLGINAIAADSDSILYARGASSLVLHPLSHDIDESNAETKKPVLDSSSKDNIRPLLEGDKDAAPKINQEVAGDTDYVWDAPRVSTLVVDPCPDDTAWKSHAKAAFSNGTSVDIAHESQMKKVPMPVPAMKNELPRCASKEILRKEDSQLGSCVQREAVCTSDSDACTAGDGVSNFEAAHFKPVGDTLGQVTSQNDEMNIDCN